MSSVWLWVYRQGMDTPPVRTPPRLTWMTPASVPPTFNRSSWAGIFFSAYHQFDDIAQLVEERGVPSAEATEWMSAGDYTVTALDRPVQGSPLPVVAERYLKWISRGLDGSAILKYLGSAQYIYRWQERYAYAAMEAARDAGCPVFDLRSIFLRQRDFDSLMSLDGIHPNPAGYQLITDTVLNAWQQSPAAN